MAFAVRFIKGVRNHWKKSIFASCVFVYVGNSMKQRYEIDNIMRVYCEEALTYGKETIQVNALPRKITVILNPAANKRSSLEDYEKYCSPILQSRNLAGICVDIVYTESEGHAKQLVQELKSTDALIVAGGDGTLSEVVTGLMRRIGERRSQSMPIGVLPLGRSNTLGLALFPGGKQLAQVRSMAEASIAIVRDVTKPMDVMKIEILEEEEEKKNAVYALCGIQWGAFRDASVNRDKYWYYGPLRKYATYIFSGYKDCLNWECNALLEYSQPCEGCSNCVPKAEKVRKRWFSAFAPSKPAAFDRSVIVNEECKKVEKKEICTTDFACSTTNMLNSDALQMSPPKLHLSLGPRSIDYLEFLREGFRREARQERNVHESIEARQIELRPNLHGIDAENARFSIDNDNFEVRPIKITLLPKVIRMFCNQTTSVHDKDVQR